MSYMRQEMKGKRPTPKGVGNPAKTKKPVVAKPAKPSKK